MKESGLFITDNGAIPDKTNDKMEFATIENINTYINAFGTSSFGFYHYYVNQVRVQNP